MNIKKHVTAELAKLVAQADELKDKVEELYSEIDECVNEHPDNWRESGAGDEWLSFLDDLDRWSGSVGDYPDFDL